jgi:hypothetical protein
MRSRVPGPLKDPRGSERPDAGIALGGSRPNRQQKATDFVWASVAAGAKVRQGRKTVTPVLQRPFQPSLALLVVKPVDK